MKRVLFACCLTIVLCAIPLAAQQDKKQQDQPPAATTSSQLDRMQRQVAAENAVAKDEAAVGRAFGKSYHDQVVAGLLSLSVADINNIPVGGAPAAAGILAPGIGDSADNLVYTPVPPCRIIDTRLAGGPIAPGTTRNFFAVGVGFAGQGGVAGSCGIPFGPATAVTINFVAVSPAFPGGDFRVFPVGGVFPNSSAINFIAFNNVANGFPVIICNPAVSVCGADISVFDDVTASNLVADVVGYFSLPTTPVTQNLTASVLAAGTLNTAQSFRATGASIVLGNAYQVDFDRDITNCNAIAGIGDPTLGVAPPGFVTVNNRAGDPNGLYITTWNSAAVATNRNFMVHVICPAAPSTP